MTTRCDCALVEAWLPWKPRVGRERVTGGVSRLGSESDGRDAGTVASEVGSVMLGLASVGRRGRPAETRQPTQGHSNLSVQGR